MTYKSLLNNFSTDLLQQSIEEELSRLVFLAKINTKHNPTKASEEISRIKEPLLLRWNCLFESESSKEISEIYKCKAWVTLATELHKQGYADKQITEQAVKSLNFLYGQRYELLTEHQDKKIQQAIDLLTSNPPIKKNIPKPKRGITQYRAGDLLSIEVNQKFHLALVLRVMQVNRYPELMLLKQVFEYEPEPTEVNTNLLADNQNTYAVTDLRYLPDAANQVQLIDSKISIPEHEKSAIITDLYCFISDLTKRQAQ